MVAILDKLKSFTPTARREAAREQLRAEVAETIRCDFRDRYNTLKARFDAAITDADNERHWLNADGLSAEAAADPSTRATLRKRSRYECQESNAYGKGIILKHSNHLIGRVPRLQMQTADKAFNKFVEKHFRKWAVAVKLGKKLRTMAKSKIVDGEAFAQFVDNPKLASVVKLDLRLIEADQVETPMLIGTEENYVSGIKFDKTGLEPLHYDVLPIHPGSLTITKANPLQPKHVPADEMLHWFREDRPNQKRGLPETSAALPLFAQLRRFTMATIAAAETAASYAGVLKTQGLPNGESAEDVDPMEIINLEMRSLLTLPQGWDLNQISAEHPATTFEMFERAILTQMSQPHCMPYNMAAGSSRGHNLASGKLDIKMYDTAIGIERYDLATEILEKIFAAWYREFKLWAMSKKKWQGEMPAFDELVFTWFFDAVDHSTDLSREASGIEKLFAVGAYGHPEYYANNGADYADAMEANADALGLTLNEYQALVCSRLYGAIPAKWADILISIAAKATTEDEEEEGTDAAEEDTQLADDTQLEDEPVKKKGEGGRRKSEAKKKEAVGG